MNPSPITARRQLHWDLAQRLGRHIRTSMKAGDCLASVRLLAREWGVSIAVVRAAQAILCEQGFLDVRQGRSVRVMARASRQCVGLYSELDLLHPRASSFHASMVRRTRAALSARGIDTELYMGTTQPGELVQEPTNVRFLEDLASHRLDGVVLIDHPVTGPWDQLVRESPVPMVGAGTAHRVELDYEEFVRTGLRLLADQGARRVAMLSWSETTTSDAFLRTAEGLGLDARPGWHRHDLHPLLSGAGWEELREVWTAYADKPDGLLVCDDVLFAEAAVAIVEMGLTVPDPLRVVAHRNAGSTLRAPFPVTWLEVDPAVAADGLVAALVRLMDGGRVPVGEASIPFRVLPPQVTAARRALPESVGSEP